LAEAFVVELKELYNNYYVLNSLKELNMDSICSIALIWLLLFDLNYNLLSSSICNILRTRFFCCLLK
jgi:hypothetical protein